MDQRNLELSAACVRVCVTPARYLASVERVAVVGDGVVPAGGDDVQELLQVARGNGLVVAEEAHDVPQELAGPPRESLSAAGPLREERDPQKSQKKRSHVSLALHAVLL